MKLKIILLFIAFGFCTRLYAQQEIPYYKEVQAFKHQDSLDFPKPGGILFIGSSSVRLWADLEQRFAGVPIIKRGLGGSELWQWVAYYTPDVLFPYNPRKIFVYAGENDIAAGKSAQFVAAQFVLLWDMMHQKLPDAEIYFMGIKQSPSRAKSYNEVLLANKLVKDYISGKSKTYFIDLNTPLFKEQTMQPDSSLFRADLLHLNSKGYDRWQAALQDYVK